MATQVGPQDYDPAYIGRRVPNALIKDNITPEPAIGSVKNQMEFYLNKIFESTNKHKTVDPGPDYH